MYLRPKNKKNAVVNGEKSKSSIQIKKKTEKGEKKIKRKKSGSLSKDNSNIFTYLKPKN